MSILVLDTETTGLPSNHLLPLDKQPRIIELFMARINYETSEVVQLYNSLINPQCKIEEDAFKAHGLREEDLKGAPLFRDIAEIVKSLIESHSEVIAHNVSFDKELIDFEFERLGRFINWPKLTCTVEQTVHIKGYRLNLQSLHELLLGEKFKEAHRAGPDTMALTRCCFALQRRGEL